MARSNCMKFIKIEGIEDIQHSITLKTNSKNSVIKPLYKSSFYESGTNLNKKKSVINNCFLPISTNTRTEQSREK